MTRRWRVSEIEILEKILALQEVQIWLLMAIAGLLLGSVISDI